MYNVICRERKLVQCYIYREKTCTMLYIERKHVQCYIQREKHVQCYM